MALSVAFEKSTVPVANPGAARGCAPMVIDARAVPELRRVELHKVAGISETLDWVSALVALDRDRLDAQVVDDTLGILVKDHDDIESLRGERLEALVGRAAAQP